MVRGRPIAIPPAYLISLLQLMILLPACLLLSLSDQSWGLSALCGGLVAIIPQAWFAVRAFRFKGAINTRLAVRSMYAGEVGKFLLSATGFAALFILLRPVFAPAVFGAYLIMLVLQIAGSWLLLRRQVAT